MMSETLEPVAPDIPLSPEDEGFDVSKEPVMAPLQSKKKRTRQNDNGKGKTGGRGMVYTPYMAYKLAEKYFKKCDETVIRTDAKTGMKVTKPKLKSGVCKYLKVSVKYFENKKELPEWQEVIDYINTETQNSVEEGILIGDYNATAGIFNLKNNHGQSDKAELKNENDTTIKIVFGD